MRKETKITLSLINCKFIYGGTERIEAKDIMKLTHGNGLEIIANGEEGRITLQLLETKIEHTKESYLRGTAIVETREHFEED